VKVRSTTDTAVARMYCSFCVGSPSFSIRTSVWPTLGTASVDALEQLDHALAGDVVLEQVACPLGALVEVGLDAGLRLLAGVEGLLGGEQRDADARSCGGSATMTLAPK
jgi:hypothetical protein